jgi:hypothetical protein
MHRLWYELAAVGLVERAVERDGAVVVEEFLDERQRLQHHRPRVFRFHMEMPVLDRERAALAEAGPTCAPGSNASGRR